LQEKDRDELLRRALTRLSPERRQVIDLVYYHEKSVDEVARILDVPPATVKTRMFYAQKKIGRVGPGRLRKETRSPASPPAALAPRAATRPPHRREA
jgi:DNA-directed RNA polymerase specialized sigma24 family protein